MPDRSQNPTAPLYQCHVDFERCTFSKCVVRPRADLNARGLSPFHLTCVKRAISLYEEFVGQMKTLEALNDAYAKVPAAFANLKDASGGSPRSLEDIHTLAANAQRVIKLYESLRGAGDSK